MTTELKALRILTHRISASFLFILFMALLASAAALAEENAQLEIPVANHSFESPVLTNGTWHNTQDGWSEPVAGGGNSFTERIEQQPFAAPNLPAEYFSSRGFNHLGIQAGEAVWQDLGVSLLPNTRYNLVVAVGNRPGATFGGNSSQISLQVNNGGSIITVASDTVDASTIASGRFRNVSVVYAGSASPPAARKNS